MKRSGHSEHRAITDDGIFLDKVRSAELPQLLKLLQYHSHKQAPLWKKVAIRRAISKLDPRPLHWVLGLEELKRMRCRMEPQDQNILDQTIQRVLSS